MLPLESKPRLQIFALVSAGALVAILLGELILRVMGVAYPAFNAPDPRTGFGHRAGVSGQYRGEGESFVRINSAGFRGPEWNKDKGPGVFRIAAVGDSFTVAFEVYEDKTFESVIQKDLLSCPNLKGQRIEVLNFGVGGYGTAQELLTLEHKVWRYNPDLVLLAFFGGNDIRNNFRALQNETLYPYFVEEEGHLVLDDSFLTSDEYRLRQRAIWKFLQSAADYSRTLQLINEAKKQWYSSSKRSAERQSNNRVEAELGLDYVVFSEPQEKVWREAWSVTEKLLLEFAAQVREHRSQFLLASMSVGIQVYPEAAVRVSFMKKMGVSDLYYVEKRLAKLAKMGRFDYLPLAPEMAEEALRTRQFYHGGHSIEKGLGHWNEAGHDFGGHRMAQRICQMVSSHSSDRR